MKQTVAVALLAVLTACNEPAANEKPPEPVESSSPTVDPMAITAAEVAIRAEPKVVDMHYDPHAIFGWTVAVYDDGTDRHGYAEYLCQVLAEKGIDLSTANVRIIDASMLRRRDLTFQEMSLGAVFCGSGDWVR